MSEALIGFGLLIFVFVWWKTCIQHMGGRVMNPRDFVEFLKEIKFELNLSGDPKVDRAEVIQAMKTFYCQFFAEDKTNGTPFDMGVLDALENCIDTHNG